MQEVPKLKTISSISGGKTSAYMALHYPADHYLFAAVLTDDPATAPKDPGILAECQRRIPAFVGSTELEMTYRNLLRLEQRLGQEITWVHAWESQQGYYQQTDQGWLPRPMTFNSLIRTRKALPNQRGRWCTEQLKVYAIFWHAYLHLMDDPNEVVWMHIGYRTDESRRVLRMQKCKDTIHFPVSCRIDGKDKRQRYAWRDFEWRIPAFPLCDDGVDHLAVLKFWTEQGWQWPNVSNCAMCFYHSDRELQHIAQTYPEQATWAIRQEDEIGARWSADRNLKQRLSTKQTLLFPESQFSCVCTD